MKKFYVTFRHKGVKDDRFDRSCLNPTIGSGFDTREQALTALNTSPLTTPTKEIEYRIVEVLTFTPPSKGGYA